MGNPVNNNPQNSSNFLPTTGNDDRLRGQDLASAMANLLAQYSTTLSYAQDNKPYDIQSITVDLSIARTNGNALKVGFPFKSYFVTEITGLATATCKLQFNDESTYAQGIPLTLKDSGVTSGVISKGYITNAAQPNTTMTIVFSVTTEFRSGSQIALSQTGVTAPVDAQAAKAGATLGAASTDWYMTLADMNGDYNGGYNVAGTFKVPAGKSFYVKKVKIWTLAATTNNMTQFSICYSDVAAGNNGSFPSGWTQVQNSPIFAFNGGVVYEVACNFRIPAGKFLGLYGYSGIANLPFQCAIEGVVGA